MKSKTIYLFKGKIALGAYSTGVKDDGFDFKLLPALSFARDVDDKAVGYALGLSFGVWTIAIAYIIKVQPHSPL